MAGVMAAVFIVAVRWMPRGRIEAVSVEPETAGPSMQQETSIR
jgi:hypothetical protein